MSELFGFFLIIAIPVLFLAACYLVMQGFFKLFTGKTGQEYAQHRYNQDRELEYQMQRHTAQRLREEGLH